MPLDSAFVQLGATRDGLDPYLDCARSRGMPAVLVETPAYLAWRSRLGRRRFDLELPVGCPQDPESVAAALARARVRAALILTGFERYVASGFAVARQLRTAPWPRCGRAFVPVDKAGQRLLLDQRAPAVRQPRSVTLTIDGQVLAGYPLDELAHPLVVKPADGGGGLGVSLVGDTGGRDRAVRRLRQATNYGGGQFRAVVVEEFVKGPEWSVQGIVAGGRPILLTACEKIITLEPAIGDPQAHGFRETGHLVHAAHQAPGGLRSMAEEAITGLGLGEGPFHVDAILAVDGPTFIEAGFRLSGAGLVGLIRRATGWDWADLVFQVHLTGGLSGEPRAAGGPGHGAIGQVTAAATAELDRARALADDRLRVEITEFAPPPSASDLGRHAELLAADLARHSGFAGRIVISGAEPAEVKAALDHCVATRLEV